MNKRRNNKQATTTQSIQQLWDNFCSRSEVIEALNELTQTNIFKGITLKQATIDQQILYRYVAVDIVDSNLNQNLKSYLINNQGQNPQFYTILSNIFARSKLFKFFNADCKFQFLLKYLVNALQVFDYETYPNIKRYLDMMQCSGQQIKNIVQVVAECSSRKTVYIKQGERVQVKSYLILALLENALIIDRRERDWNQKQRVLQFKKTISQIIDEIVNNLSNKQSKQLLIDLIDNSFVLLMNNCPISLSIINNIVYSLQSKYKFLQSSQQKVQCLQLLYHIASIIINKAKHLGQFNVISNDQKHKCICNFCRLNKRKVDYYSISDHIQIHQLSICEDCKISTNKIFKKDSQTELVDLILLMFCRSQGQFTADEQMKSRQTYIYQLLSPLGVQTNTQKNQISRIVSMISEKKVEKRIKILSSLASNILVFYHKAISLQTHLATIIQLWIYETSNNESSKRAKALRQFKHFLPIFCISNPPNFIKEYVRHLKVVLKHKSEDIKQNVRLQAIKQLIRSFRQSNDAQLLPIICDRIRDPSAQIRKIIINGLLDLQNDIMETDKKTICEIVHKLVERTLDEFESIRKTANTVLICFFSHKKCLKILDELVLQIINTDQYEFDDVIVKNLVLISKGSEKIEDQYKKVVTKIVNKNEMSKNESLFLEVISANNLNILNSSVPKLIVAIKEILHSLTPSNYEIAGHLVKTLNILIQEKKILKKIPKQDAEDLTQLLEKAIKSQLSSVIQYFVPLYIELCKYTNDYDRLKIFYKSCDQLMNSLRGKRRIDQAQYRILERCLKVITLLAVGMARSVDSYETFTLVSLYESIVYFAGIQQKHIRYVSVWCLCQFWDYDDNFLISTFDLLKSVIMELEDTNIILTLYNYFYKKLNISISNKKTEQLEQIKIIFLKSYQKFYANNSFQLKLSIVRILQRLLSIGIIASHLHNDCIFSYLCDSSTEIKEQATKIVQNTSEKFLFMNFLSAFKSATLYIWNTYGEITTGFQDCFFFQSLILKTLNTKLKKSQRKTQVTFIKKLADVVKDGIKSYFSTNQMQSKQIQLICQILLRVKSFQATQFESILIALNEKILTNSNKTEVTLKKLIKIHQNEIDNFQDSDQSQSLLGTQSSNIKGSILKNIKQQSFNAIKAARLLYMVKYTMNVLTGGLSVSDKMRDVQIHRLENVVIKAGKQFKHIEFPDNLQELYENLFQQISFCDSQKKSHSLTPTKSQRSFVSSSRSNIKSRSMNKKTKKSTIRIRNKATPKFKAVSPQQQQKQTKNNYGLRRQKRVSYKSLQ